MSFYLRMGEDTLEQAARHPSMSAALDAFREVAEELNGYGQKIEASVHIADRKRELAEYPDYLLSLRRSGGVKVERC